MKEGTAEGRVRGCGCVCVCVCGAMKEEGDTGEREKKTRNCLCAVLRATLFFPLSSLPPSLFPTHKHTKTHTHTRTHTHTHTRPPFFFCRTSSSSHSLRAQFSLRLLRLWYPSCDEPFPLFVWLLSRPDPYPFSNSPSPPPDAPCPLSHTPPHPRLTPCLSPHPPSRVPCSLHRLLTPPSPLCSFLTRRPCSAWTTYPHHTHTHTHTPPPCPSQEKNHTRDVRKQNKI